MYHYKRKVNLSYQEATEKLKEEFKKEGFGVLTEINVRETLKKKLDVEFENYVILGACNPPFAFKALQIERDIGLLMPCNVIVYELQNQTYIAATKPTVTMGVINQEQLTEVAQEVEQKLINAVNNV